MHRSATALLLVLLIGCSSHLSTLPVDPKPPAPATLPAGSYVLSPQNTRITFVGTALIASHEGTFTRFTGQLACPDSLPQNARFTVEIDMESVFTEIPLLTKHLKDSGFFDSEKYPRATFVSTEISTSSVVASSYIIAGNLTLHGITKAISFPAQFNIDPAQISLDATITLRQDDFKMESARTTTNEVPVTVKVRILRPSQAGL